MRTLWYHAGTRRRHGPMPGHNMVCLQLLIPHLHGFLQFESEAVFVYFLLGAQKPHSSLWLCETSISVAFLLGALFGTFALPWPNSWMLLPASGFVPVLCFSFLPNRNAALVFEMDYVFVLLLLLIYLCVLSQECASMPEFIQPT